MLNVAIVKIKNFHMTSLCVRRFIFRAIEVRFGYESRDEDPNPGIL